MLAPVPAAVIQAPPPKLHSAGWLRSLLSVVMVQVADDGRLLDCNAGFQRLMPCTPDSGAAQPDIRSFFVRPAFDQLLAVHGPDGEPVFEGILNVVDMHGVCRSLLGSVHRVGRHVMVVAEYDVADMERLTAQVITLNQELAEVQRSLARANRDLRTNEARLELLSVTDPLTGLANRRRLMEFMALAWERAQRHASSFSIIMADIDFFKKITDGHGHDQGDAVLRAVSAQMQTMVRKTDLVARFGGEEFVIVLEEAPLPAALDLAERLRLAACALHFDCMPDGITCSYGVAQLGPGEKVEQVIKHADEALYRAKHGGRNQVTHYLPDV